MGSEMCIRDRIEGTYQDLSTQHQTVAQQLAADQQENASLKQRISQLNAEIAQIKPRLEKMRSEARQQKGMVAINKKQLTTNEGERGNMDSEISTLEAEAAERIRQLEERERQQQERELQQQERERQQGELERQLEEQKHQLQEQEVQLAERQRQHGERERQHGERERQHGEKERQLRDEEHSRSIASPQPTSSVISPALSTGAGTNPFFRSQGAPREAGTMSPGGFMASAPSPSAFDALFGPSFSAQQPTDTNAPPTTSFKAVEAQHSATSGQSASSDGRPTPSATPPLSAGHDLEPPPPPESRQFTPGNLPLRSLQHEPSFDSSTRAAAPGSVDNRSVATGPITSPFDGTNTFDHSSFGHEDVSTPPAQTSGPSFQELHAEHAQTNEPVQLPTPLPEAESMPGAFPEDGVTPMSTQTTGLDRSLQPPEGNGSSLARASSHDDFDSAFAGFGEPAQSKGKEPAHEAPEPAHDGQPAASHGFGDEFPAIQEVAVSDDSDSESDRGFDDDFSAGPSANNGAPLERAETQHIEHGALGTAVTSSELPSFASAIAQDHTARPVMTQESRVNTDLPPITAQTSPPSYDNIVDHPRSGSNGQLPPEFGGLLPSREDPTQSPVPHSIPHTIHETPTTANSESFHSAGSSFPTASVAPAQPPAMQKSAFDDEFADFDDLAEAKEASVDDAFGNDSEVRGDEFNPTFDSPGRHSAEATPVMPKAQPAFYSNAFDNFGGNAGNGYGHGQQPSISTAFGQAPATQGNQDWDAIFSGLDTSPAITTDPGHTVGAAAFSPFAPTSSGSTSAAAAAPSSQGHPFPGFDNSRDETSSHQQHAAAENQQPAKPTLGRAITNTGEHDDPTVKRLVGMGFGRDKAVKALEDFDYNIDAVSFFLPRVMLSSLTR